MPYTLAKKQKQLARSRNNVMGCVHPFRQDYRVTGSVPEGTTVYEAVRQACEAAKIRKRLLNYGVAQVGRRDYEKQITVWEFVPFSQWKKRKLGKDELLRFRILPKGGGGGGGGKSGLNTLLSIVVMVAAIAAAAFTGGLSIFGATGALYMGGVGSAIASGLAGMAVLTIGQALVNAIAPVSTPSLGGLTSANANTNKEQDVYSISSGRNQIKQWGRVPVPVGRGRYAPPKAAAPYTQLSGDDQVLHELLCLGIGDMDFSDIRIGTTPIEEFNDVQYEIMTYNPKSPKAPKYYPTGVMEETLNIQLKQYETHVRTTTECDKAEIDISFQGLCRINEYGWPEWETVYFGIRYREHGSNSNWGDIWADDSGGSGGGGSGGSGTNSSGWTVGGIPKTYSGWSNWVPWKQGEFTVFINFDTGLTYQEGRKEPPARSFRLGYWKYQIKGESYTEPIYDATSNNRTWNSVTVTKYIHHFEFEQDYKGNNTRIDGFQVTVKDGIDKRGVGAMEWRDQPMGSGMSVTGGTITLLSGQARIFQTRSGRTTVNVPWQISGNQTRLLRRTKEIVFPKRGKYDIAIIRYNDDSYDNKVRNDSYWTALRSISNDLPVKTDYPVMLLSLQIKATGQLSGQIDTLTVYYQTKCWDFKNDSNTWVWRYSSNPACIMRYLLQQKDAFSRPQSDSMLDLSSLAYAAKYYDACNFRYDKVIDSSVSIFERLVSIGASCLSSPTMLDGKWGVIVDRERTHVVCAFTSANAWSWKFERTQIRLPNAIHCNFISEETWDADMRVIKTDELNNGDYLYETQDYDGVTNPEQVFQLARFHYADAKLRRRTISFRCYDESILCTRGDLIECACPNINVAGLQVGRIRKINKNSSGLVTSLGTDQINTTDLSGRVFGVRIYSNSGNIYHARIKAVNKSERLLTLTTPQSMNIQVGNQYAFGDYSEEVFQAVVLSMKFNSDWTCDVTCQDYTPEIYGDLSKPIPEFKSIITKAIDHKWKLYGIPIIVGLTSDETALVRGVDGVLYCRIMVYMKDAKDIDPKTVGYQCEIRDVYKDAPEDVSPVSEWRVAVRIASIEQSYFYINDVDEGAEYDIRVRYVGAAGEWGAWSEVVRHVVEGKIMPPPDVQNFRAGIDNPKGVKLAWDMLKVLDIDYYLISGDADIKAESSPVWAKVYQKTGLLTFGIVAVDTGGRTSVNTAYAVARVYPPNNVTIKTARLLNSGIVLTWSSSATTWDIDHYHIASGALEGDFTGLKGTLPFTGKFPIGQYAQMTAVDIFKNWTLAPTQQEIKVYYPQTPKIKFGVNKLTGNITLDWQDCTSVQTTDPPRIDHYELSGTLANNQVVEVFGTHYETVVPLQVYEFGSGNSSEGILVNVGNLYISVQAVDKYGISSRDKPDYKDNQINIGIYPPYNPTNFGISASLTNGTKLDAKWTESTAIMLTWRDCERTFAIDYYEVYDYFTNTTYKVATNYVVLKARKEGSYKITVQAFDILGQSSAKMQYNLNIGGVGGMTVTARIDGADIVLEWSTPDASFQIDHYLVFEDNDDIPSGTNADQNRAGYLGTAKFNYYRIPAKDLGSYTYYVWAVDVAGNINSGFANYTTINIVANNAPSISAKLAGTGIDLSWKTANKPSNSLPVSAWDVRRYNRLSNVNQIPLNTPVQDYGRIDADKLHINAFTVGNYSFCVRAIDSGGNEGAWGKLDFSATAPGQITFVNTLVIDNNVQLYWTAPNKIFFPIREYLFDEIDKDTNLPMRIGSVDALFASEVEEVSGTYTYAITPVDWGGNLGTPTRTTLRVSQPPDFVFYDHKKSLFNGTKSNFQLDGNGGMLGPLVVNETWNQNIARMKTLAGTDITTHQQKVNKGWTTWPEPWASSGYYREVIDHGTQVPSTNYKVTLGYQTLHGSPTITCKVELSENGTTWRVGTDNAFMFYATQFRYSRVTITVTGGYVRIYNLEINLDVKKLTDYGRTTCDKDDNGDGWVSEASTPMLTGTWIPFKVDFVDVQSLPRPNVVVKTSADSGYTAYTVFEDVLNPKGFRCFVKDKNGNRVSADVDWVAMGV